MKILLYVLKRDTATGALWLGLIGAMMVGGGNDWGLAVIACAWAFDVFAPRITKEQS